jgi:biopolymer transport protein ExbD
MARRPKRSGVILRFVDMVFNLLFAFIAIAQVSAKRIELPQTATSEVPEETLSFTVIVQDGRVLVDEQVFTLPELSVKGKDRGPHVEELADWLDAQYRASPRAREVEPVQIRPERGSKVQYTIDVYDACRRTGREAAIVVEPY